MNTTNETNTLVKRVLIWSVPLVVLIVVLSLLFRPRAELVDIAVAEQRPMQVTIDEEGQTRAREVFTIAAPVGGRLLRTTLKEGDAVYAHQTAVASIEPSDAEFLDPRTQAESEAARDAAKAAYDLASAELRQMTAERDFAAAEVIRFRTLFAKGTVPKQRVDDAERAAQSTQASVEAARARLNVAASELTRAEARLITPADNQNANTPCECVTVRSPVNGTVLRVIHKSETIVTPGAPLIEVSDADDLEIVVDLLSEDAVQVAPGDQVIIDGWGGDQPLQANVRQVEPYAFTKVSALGIEEQRVNVILDFVGTPEQWLRLGHGYRVQARIVTWSADEVLAIPLTALFEQDDAWSVFVDDDGYAKRQPIEVGHLSGLWAEVTAGLQSGDRIVKHPNDRISSGTRLRVR